MFWRFINVTFVQKIVKTLNLTYSSQVTSSDWKTDCQWCWSFEIITTFIATSMHNKDQDECDQRFDDYTLNRLHVSAKSSQTQIIIQNCIRCCELKKQKKKRIELKRVLSIDRFLDSFHILFWIFFSFFKSFKVILQIFFSRNFICIKSK